MILIRSGDLRILAFKTQERVAAVFSERELTFTFAICYRRSVCLSSICRLSVVCLWRWCALLSRLKFSAIFLRHLVPWPFVDIHWKFYGDRPMGTPPSGDLNARGVVKYSDFDMWNAITSKRCKSYMGFRLVQKLVTLNDLERRNFPYFTLFYRIW